MLKEHQMVFVELTRRQARDAPSTATVDFLGSVSVMRAIQSLSRNMAARRVKRQKRRQIASELAVFTDWDLSELGFSRSDFHAIEQDSYRR
jgi:hypothetical protein